MKAITLILAAFFLMSNGCKKGNSDVIKTEAIVKDLGSPATDGCGWVITVGDVTYKPIILDDKYQNDLQAVIIEYELTGEKYSCPFSSGPNYDKIRIKTIKAK
ncbi:hypothetical protein [Arcticibacter eurypsychrophilus]|uniref:hypothetical protein n=1 Tax=Arcticibacter eurypsychrophilus TaxID=1434752 RepID=UPI00084D6B1D|nr:hypothetical protein [Arcticibacter eurypsychrophilus]